MAVAADRAAGSGDRRGLLLGSGAGERNFEKFVSVHSAQQHPALFIKRATSAGGLGRRRAIEVKLLRGPDPVGVGTPVLMPAVSIDAGDRQWAAEIEQDQPLLIAAEKCALVGGIGLRLPLAVGEHLKRAAALVELAPQTIDRCSPLGAVGMVAIGGGLDRGKPKRRSAVAALDTRGHDRLSRFDPHRFPRSQHVAGCRAPQLHLYHAGGDIDPAVAIGSSTGREGGAKVDEPGGAGANAEPVRCLGVGLGLQLPEQQECFMRRHEIENSRRRENHHRAVIKFDPRFPRSQFQALPRRQPVAGGEFCLRADPPAVFQFGQLGDRCRKGKAFRGPWRWPSPPHHQQQPGQYQSCQRHRQPAGRRGPAGGGRERRGVFSNRSRGSQPGEAGVEMGQPQVDFPRLPILLEPA